MSALVGSCFRLDASAGSGHVESGYEAKDYVGGL